MDSAAFTENPMMSPPAFYPELRASDEIGKIRDAFFAHDCVLLRGLLNPHKLKFFRDICNGVYAKDDVRFKSGDTQDEDWLRQYKNGWVWEDRLREETRGVFGYEDIMANKKLYDVLNALLGTDWHQTSSSQIRRMAPNPDLSPWNSMTVYHMDSQWGIDYRYIINIWAPFTACGKDAPGLQFILSPAEYIRGYSKYDPNIPLEPSGPGGISPRMDYQLFDADKMRAHFHPKRFWAPAFEPGDVVIFSSWCTHCTYLRPEMNQPRMSIEWRLSIPTFDTVMRR